MFKQNSLKVIFKKYSPILSFLIVTQLTTFLLISCEDEVTRPPSKPPGYQEDIPWPSLANSPWPIYRADPQNTGRSKFVEFITGDTELRIDTLWPASGVTVSEDSTLFFIVHSNYLGLETGGLVAMEMDGTIKWEYRFFVDEKSPSSNPIISSNGTIYLSSNDNLGQNSEYLAINPNGTIKWKIQLADRQVIQLGNNIGLDGRIYAIARTNFNSAVLLTINPSGYIEWELPIDGASYLPADGISFSPDGKTIYIPGYFNSNTVFAIDLEMKRIKWKFGNGRMYLSSTPLIDSQGHIYVVAKGNSDEARLFSLNEDGLVRWSYEINDVFQRFEVADLFTMDKQGNIYIGLDTLYSIDYEGKLRWKIGVTGLGGITSPIVCDNKGEVIFTTGTNNATSLTKISNSGQIIWNISFSNLNYSGFNVSPSLFFGKYIYPYTSPPTHNPALLIIN